MRVARIAWALWAVLPVAAFAYHFGPGQAIYQHERAVELQRQALELERDAMALHRTAYARHLEAVDARRVAAGSPTPEAEALANAATEQESRAFGLASAAWRLVADAFGRIQEVAKDASPATLRTIRWSRSRALVRAGDLWTGIRELEDVLGELEADGLAGSSMARTTREELASAYYYAARLMRLSGEPAEEWFIESGKARQHFRYLAERERAKGLNAERAKNYEQNVELVLDLEQSTLLEIQGKPLPEDSPLGRTGNRPGRGEGKTKRPPRGRDGRGAGGAQDIREGW